MKTAHILSCILSMTAPAAADYANSASECGNIIVDAAPDFVRPYVLPKYRGRAIKLTPSQIIRFSITANSSAGAFSLVQHNGKESGWLSARPYTHRVTHEHFYCARGRVQLWGQKNATGSIHEARLTDPDTQLTHVFHPGGFEHLFDEFSQGDYDTKKLASTYATVDADADPFGPLTDEQDTMLMGLDLYAAREKDYIPRRDFVNGTAGDKDLKWHNGANNLSNDAAEPYFIAKDYGPKYLNSEGGFKVIQPLATGSETGGNFTMGTITMSPKVDNQSASTVTLPHHFAIQMDDGQLVLSVKGYGTASLMHGDVAFIPSGVEFTYHATVPYTKFLYMNAGDQGLDHQLINHEKTREWKFSAYPNESGQQQEQQ